MDLNSLISSLHQISLISLAVTNFALALYVHFGYKSLFLQKVRDYEELAASYTNSINSSYVKAVEVKKNVDK